MYVVVRKDLTAPQIMVQAAHASIEVARHSLIPENIEHPHLVVLGVDNEQKLRKALEHIQSMGIVCKEFREADLNGELTAFATEPLCGEKRRIFRKYQLIKTSDFMRAPIGGAA